MYNYFVKGVTEKKGEPSITEGIGQARVTKNLELCNVDSSYYVTDSECMNILFKLIKNLDYNIKPSYTLKDNSDSIIKIIEELK